MNELFEGLELEDSKVAELSEAFDKAVMKKSVELMETHVAEKVAEEAELIKEEYAEKVESLEATLDGYLTSIVEEFVTENAPTYKVQIQDEKTVAILEAFDKFVTLTGVDLMQIQEAKDIADESGIEYELARQTEKVADLKDELIESRREADQFLKAGLIAEMAEDLTVVEKTKFEKLAEMITFGRNEKFKDALDNIKESIIDNRDDSFNESFGGTVTAPTLPNEAFTGNKLDLKAATNFSKYV